MFTHYIEKNNVLEITKIKDKDLDKVEPKSLISITAPEKEELEEIANLTKIPLDMLLKSLDEEEMAHIDIDDENYLIVIDIPYFDEEEPSYYTVPLFILYNEDYIVTICRKRLNTLKTIINQIKKFEPHKHVRVTLLILYKVATQYIQHLKMIDKKSREVENKLHSSMKNEELIELMELNKMLVYFSTSLNSNRAVSQKLMRLPSYKKYEEDQDLIEDVIVENDQAIEMCSIYRDILAGTMDAFASIISNNLSVVMKRLAIITIVMSIPTIIASFLGMNLEVPLADNAFGFWIAIGISGLVSLIGGIIIYFFGQNRSKKRLLKLKKKENRKK